MLYVLIFNLLLGPSAAKAEDPPRIINSVEEKKVELGSGYNQALKLWMPLFRLYTASDFAKTIGGYFSGSTSELPMAVLGDFDGDGRTDVALLGYTLPPEPKTIVVIAANDGKKISIHPVKEYLFADPKVAESFVGPQKEYGLFIYLSLLKKEDLEFEAEGSKSDALQVEVWGAPSTASYIIRNGEVVSFRGQVKN